MAYRWPTTSRAQNGRCTPPPPDIIHVICNNSSRRQLSSLSHSLPGDIFNRLNNTCRDITGNEMGCDGIRNNHITGHLLSARRAYCTPSSPPPPLPCPQGTPRCPRYPPRTSLARTRCAGTGTRPWTGLGYVQNIDQGAGILLKAQAEQTKPRTTEAFLIFFHGYFGVCTRI